jgi:hypothetical protein
MSLPPRRRVVVLPLAWLAVALALPACPRDGEGALAFSPLAVCFRVEEPAEKVFRTAGEWEAFHRASALRPSDGAPPVDFAQKMVVGHFDGSGSACVGFTVERVEVGKEAVTVRATRHASPNPCILVVAYPQLVLELPRRDLPVKFRIVDARDAPPASQKACF